VTPPIEMTVQDLIAMLEHLKNQHGPETKVVLDGYGVPLGQVSLVMSSGAMAVRLSADPMWYRQ